MKIQIGTHSLMTCRGTDGVKLALESAKIQSFADICIGHTNTSNIGVEGLKLENQRLNVDMKNNNKKHVDAMA